MASKLQTVAAALQFLALLCCATPLVGQIYANAALTLSPGSYLIVAVPDNYQSDPVSCDLIAGFKRDPTLLALRRKTQYWTYTASNPDWQHRWSARVQQLPAVIVIDNGAVRYKRSRVGAKTVSYECQRGGLLQRLLRPVTRPDSCPGPNCPVQPYEPYQPYDPQQPDQPTEPVGPLSPLQPIPDTPIVPDGGVLPLEPPQPTIDRCAALELELTKLVARVETLERRDVQGGSVGPQGPAGPPGPRGEVGESGVTPNVDPEQLAKLWSFQFRVVDPAGVFTTEPVIVHNGERLNLRLEPVRSNGVSGLTQPTVDGGMP